MRLLLGIYYNIIIWSQYLTKQSCIYLILSSMVSSNTSAVWSALLCSSNYLHNYYRYVCGKVNPGNSCTQGSNMHGSVTHLNSSFINVAIIIFTVIMVLP